MTRRYKKPKGEPKRRPKQSPKVKRRLSSLPDVPGLISRVRAGEDALQLIKKLSLPYGSQVELAARFLCFGIAEKKLADVRLSTVSQDIHEGWDVEIDGAKLDFTINPQKAQKGSNRKGHQVILLSRSELNSWATGMAAGYAEDTLKDFLGYVKRGGQR